MEGYFPSRCCGFHSNETDQGQEHAAMDKWRDNPRHKEKGDRASKIKKISHKIS